MNLPFLEYENVHSLIEISLTTVQWQRTRTVLDNGLTPNRKQGVKSEPIVALFPDLYMYHMASMRQSNCWKLYSIRMCFIGEEREFKNSFIRIVVQISLGSPNHLSHVFKFILL